MATVHLERARRRRPRQRPWQVLLPWVLTVAILFATAVAAFWPREPELRPPEEVPALVWGDAVFTSPLELEAWLRTRGVEYKTWARRHPEAVRLLVGPAEGEKPAGRPQKPIASGADESLTSRRSLTIFALLGVFGAALALLVSRYGTYARRFRPRAGVLGAAAAVAIAVSVAALLA